MRWLIVIAFLSSPLHADERGAFFGTWGTPLQCDRAPIRPGGTMRAAPVRIGPEWLSQGTTWCRLRWFPIEQRDASLFTGAFAHCGEDAPRSYMLGMVLIGEEMSLRWDLFTSNGPLKRCPDP